MAAKPKRPRLMERLVKFILLFAILWIAAGSLHSFVQHLLIKTMTIGKAVVETTYSPYGFMVYGAYLMDAPLSGEGTPITAEGARVRKNSAVFRVNGVSGSAMQNQSEKIMYAPLPGLVSYQMDAYETIRSAAEVMTLDLAEIYTQERESPHKQQNAQAGEPYAKIINNLDDIFLYLDCEKNGYTETFAPDVKFRIRFPEIAYSTICRVVSVEKFQRKPNEAERLMVQVDLGTAEQDVFAHRVWQTELPYDIANVIEIPKSAIIYQEGQPGVYALDKGFAYWTDIEITAEKSETVVVDNLTEGTEIVITPQFVKEGDYVKMRG